MSKFEESNFYKALQDFFINADKKTFLEFLAEFYNRTEGIINKDNIQDELIKELRELYLEFNEKGIDENIVREKVNYFIENSTKIKDVISKLNANTNNIENITSQLDTKTKQLDSVEINVLYPPNGLSPLINDGIFDNTTRLKNIVDYIVDNNLKTTLIFPNVGTYYFSNMITIDNALSSIFVEFNNSKIKLKDNDTTENSLFFLKNIKEFSVKNAIVYSTNSLASFVQVNNADKLILDNINVDDIGTVLKINFNYDISTQFLVKELITNNIKCNNVRFLMHVCNVNKWDGFNICGNVSKTKALPNRSVGFYLRPQTNNVNLSNLNIRGCTGDVFHFNRVDYTQQDGYFPPFGTEGYIDKNIKINNITVSDFGNLVGFNSEVNDMIINNVTCIDTCSESMGIIASYEGYCNNIKITNFNFENISRLIYLNSTVNNDTVSHRPFGTIAYINGEVNGELKKTCVVCGTVKDFILDNIVFNGIDGNLTSSSIVCRFLKDMNVKLNNLTFNLNGNLTRITELFKINNNGRTYINNIYVNRNSNAGVINIFATNGIPDGDKLKLYLGNIYLYNLGSGSGLYYGNESILTKNNCYIDDVIVP